MELSRRAGRHPPDPFYRMEVKVAKVDVTIVLTMGVEEMKLLRDVLDHPESFKDELPEEVETILTLLP